MSYSNISSTLSYGNINNGNISTFNSLNEPGFEKYEDKLRNQTPIYDDRARTATKGIAGRGFICKDNGDGDELSALFYSDENVKRLQNMIRREIFNRTNGQYKLDVNQDDADLLMIMRAVYFEQGKYLPFKIVKQVKELNKKVLDYAIPDMITAIKQTYSYIKEINEPIKPIPPPINVSHAGRKTLPALTTVFGF
jgi:hypothetical protein